MDEQTQDRKQLEYELEAVFDELMEGLPLTLEQINLLRYAVGFKEIKMDNGLKEMFNNMNVWGKK